MLLFLISQFYIYKEIKQVLEFYKIEANYVSNFLKLMIEIILIWDQMNERGKSQDVLKINFGLIFLRKIKKNKTWE